MPKRKRDLTPFKGNIPTPLFKEMSRRCDEKDCYLTDYVVEAIREKLMRDTKNERSNDDL